MQVTIDKEILEILDFVKASEEKIDTSINILLLEGIESLISNEMFSASDMTKGFLNLKITALKVKYMIKMMEDLSDD